MNNSNTLPVSVRVVSIDVVRALTMILMIFVNDLWSLKDIPAWLDHVKWGEDGIGLADVVFPAFLFTVGLSLPFAIQNRRAKGDTNWQQVQHVLSRTIALLVMGVFLVNGETFNAAATGMASYWWNPLCCLCFILIWNSYPKTISPRKAIGLKAVAITALVVLAYFYHGGEEENIQRFAPQWWGILGLIGWAYLVSGLVTVFAGNKLYIVIGSWVFFAALSVLFIAGQVPDIFSFIPNAILGGTLTGLTLSGVLTAMVFQHYSVQNAAKRLTMVLSSFAALLIVLSVITRPYWGLSKLGATPAWLFLCSAFTILTFLLCYWVADVWKKEKWFNIIRPAGNGTLLCYLIPYFIYAAMNLTGLHLPEAVLAGGIGLIKSFLFAMLCAIITGWLMKLGIRLKL